MTRELVLARQAASLAAQEILELYASFAAIADAPAEISTEADRRAQEIILQFLGRHFPGDAFCAEEDSPTLQALSRRGERLWVIDPIDGTRGFARKNGEFSVMIGLVERGQVSLGVVQEPARGRCTFAARGQGCFRQDQAAAEPSRCQVSRVAVLDQARWVRSRSEKGDGPQAPGLVHDYLFHYSAGIKLAMIARGEADIYTSGYQGFHAWDVCAGQILVEEAGGLVRDSQGGVIRYEADGGGPIRGTAATNGPLQNAAYELLKPAGKK